MEVEVMNKFKGLPGLIRFHKKDNIAKLERSPLVQKFLEAAALQRVYQRKCVLTRILPIAEKKLWAAECGVYKGFSLIAMGEVARIFGIRVHFFGLDTFEGLPDISTTDQNFIPKDALYLTKKLFTNTSLEDVKKTLNRTGLRRKYTLLKGLFSKTLAQLPERKYFFVHIDCDLYDGHIECLEYFYPRMLSGGIIFFDDYHSVSFPMARAAIDDFLKSKPEKLFHTYYHLAETNYTKAYLIKG